MPENDATAVKELFEWLAIPSISTDPSHAPDMRRAAEWLRNKLNSIGFSAKVEETKGHPVVFAEHLKAGPNAPTILVYGHYDVQPVDPINEWQTPPFEPAVRDGNMFARGSTDDKGQVFAHVVALEHILTNGTLPVNLKLLVEGEEEIGSPNLQPYLEANRSRLACDAVVISDGPMFAPGVPTLTTGLRGLCYMEVHVQGASKDLHSGMYGGAVANPLNALAEIIYKLKDENGKISIPGFYDSVLELSLPERQAWQNLPFSESEFANSVGVKNLPGEVGYSALERTWARPSLDVNGVWGGFQGEGQKTVLPAKAGAKISMRLVPNQDPTEIAKLFTEQVQNLAPLGVTVEVRHLHDGLPVLVDSSSPAALAARDALAEVYPAKEVVFVRSGGTIPVVAAFRQLLNAPVLLLDFGLPDDGAHGPNEKFSLECFSKGIEVSHQLWPALAARLKK